MVDLLTLARQRLSDEQLWVNPDCGLKTRGWEEVRPALANMVAAARRLRCNRIVYGSAAKNDRASPVKRQRKASSI